MSDQQKNRIFTDFIEIKDLGFQFSTYAESIYKIIKNIDNHTPFTIVVNGKWGSGKTQLLKAVCNNIETLQNDDRVMKYVWFNAWKYSKQNDLLSSLIQEIFSQIILSEGFSVTGIKLRLKKASDKVGLLEATTDLLNVLNPGKEVDLTKWIHGTKWENEEPFYKYFDRYLSEILQTIISEKKGKSKDAAIVFFIDDLDRCPPPKVVEILEIINLCFDKSKCIFILGLDISYVIHCVDVYYNDYKSENFTGIEYLQKVINLRFDIPEKSDKDFTIYIELNYASILKIFPEVNLLIKSINSNIRNLKQFINSFYLFKEIIPSNLSENLLFKFLLIQYVDTKLIYYIKKEPNLLIILQEYAKIESVELHELINNFISEEYLKTDQMNIVLEILKEQSDKFKDSEQVKSFLQCAVTESRLVPLNEITVVANGDMYYELGEMILFSGEAKPNSTIFLSIEKPDIPFKNFRPDKLLIASKNNDEKTFKRILVPSSGIWEFRWDTQPYNAELKLGTYKLYVSNGPYDLLSINKNSYDYINFIITEPKYLNISLSKNTYLQHSRINISGVVSGIIPKFLAYWIIKDHSIIYGTFQIDEKSFNYSFDKSITENLDIGQYFLIIQHPMRNNKFDIYFNDSIKTVESLYPGEGTIVLSKEEYSQKKGVEIAELIYKFISDEKGDDYCIKAHFLIE